MSDIIGQAMGILGGGKKDKAPTKQVVKESAPARTPAGEVNEMLDTAERRVKSELARYGLLHARLLEARELLKNGSDGVLVENRIRFALNEAKVTIK